MTRPGTGSAVKCQSCSETDTPNALATSCGRSSTRAKSGPASISRTDNPGSSESRAARAAPLDPPPTTMWSYLTSSLFCGGRRDFVARRLLRLAELLQVHPHELLHDPGVASGDQAAVHHRLGGLVAIEDHLGPRRLDVAEDVVRARHVPPLQQFRCGAEEPHRVADRADLQPARIHLGHRPAQELDGGSPV